MIEAVRRSGRVFQTGTQRRSMDRVRHVCELVRNGRIGKVLRASAGVGLPNRECDPTWQPEPVPPGFDYNLWLGPAPWEPYHHLRCHYSFRFILDYSGGQITNNGAHWADVVQWALGKDGSGPVEATPERNSRFRRAAARPASRAPRAGSTPTASASRRRS